MSEELRIRMHGNPALPTLIYFPGLHGDWTLINAFREAILGKIYLVEITYPRTLTWTISDYATNISNLLRDHQIHQGWILGESFGSQVAWALLQHQMSSDAPALQIKCNIRGIILAGGFVKHPIKYGPSILSGTGKLLPMPFYTLALNFYMKAAKFRNRKSPAAIASLKDFAERRTRLDRLAMRHRLALLSSYDSRDIARKTKIQVYQIAGLFDPIVPSLLVRRWLRSNCPGFRESKILVGGGHPILVSRPAQSAYQILRWLGTAG